MTVVRSRARPLAGGRGLAQRPTEWHVGCTDDLSTDEEIDLSATIETPATVQQVRIVSEFRSDEHDRIRELLSQLDRPLSRFDAGAVDLELSIKERESSRPKTVLECWIAGWPRMVATSREEDMTRAVTEVRQDLKRQIDEAVRRRRGR